MKRLAAICAALGFVGAVIGFAAGSPAGPVPAVAGSSWASPISLGDVLGKAL